MKKLRSKIILTVVLALTLLASVFVINMVASPTYTRVTFMHGGTSYSEVVETGGSLTLPTPEAKLDGTVYGWYDKAGNFYNCGDTFTPSENTVLYCAEGVEISLSGSLPLALSKGYSYVKLNSNITINNTINVPNGLFYLDLNGNNFSLNTDGDGFVGEDFGIILANSQEKHSTLTHTASGELAFSVNSFASLSPIGSAKYLSFVIGENVTLKENMNLVTVTTNISAFEKALRIDLFGSLESGRIIRGNGLNNAIFEIYDGASLKTTCEYFFEDVGTTAQTAATLIVNGGHLDNALSTSYANDTTKFKALVYGGTFTADSSKFFTLGNYVSTYNSQTGIYTFSKCNHAGSLVEHAPNCTTDVTLDHFCKYCETVFEKRYPSGVGHSYLPELTQDIVNTPEETIAGCYTLTCTKCGHKTVEYTYPDPATVYVTVGFMEGDEEKYLRFPSTDLFSFDGTKILSFSADALYYDKVNKKGEVTTTYIQQTSVFHVEIPLGTTEIFGNTFTYNGVETPTGVFLRNDHLKSVSFPVSIKNINKYSFSSMPNLETLYGLENITGTIDKGAFMQNSESKLYIENMVLNAKQINEDAFKNVRMKTLTFGENVSGFQRNAFALDTGLISYISEVFIEGNRLGEGKTVHEVFSNLRKGQSAGQQFDGLNIVYYDHNYSAVTVPSTCIEYGYDLLTCDRCGFIEKSNVQEAYAPHAYIPHSKPATCQTLGYEGEICTVCDYIHVWNDIYYDRTNHSFTKAEVKRPAVIGSSVCVDAYYTLGQCACGAVEPDTPENRSEVMIPDANASHKMKKTVVVASSCGQNGYTKLTCTVCGEVRYEIDKYTNGHKWVDTILEPATCKTGSTGYTQCSICNEKRDISSPVVDPNAHIKKNGDNGQVVQEATTSHSGSIMFLCAYCGADFYEVIPPLESVDNSVRFLGINWVGRTILGVSVGAGVIVALVIIAGLIVIGLLLFGIVITLVFTFTKKRNKSKKYNYGFNASNKEKTTHVTRTVEEQLADIDINLSDEIPPAVELDENGNLDEEAAFTAYLTALSAGDATRELSVEDDNPFSSEEPWLNSYVESTQASSEEAVESQLKDPTEEKPEEK